MTLTGKCKSCTQKYAIMTSAPEHHKLKAERLYRKDMIAIFKYLGLSCRRITGLFFIWGRGLFGFFFVLVFGFLVFQKAEKARCPTCNPNPICTGGRD
jgi:hypothetical protein